MRKTVRNGWGWRVVVAGLFAALLPCPGYAQLLSGTLPTLTTLSAATGSSVQPGNARDVITGSNSPGPYALTWRGIPASRETVTVDGFKMMRGVDYAIDYANGLIAFTSPLHTGSVALVEYPVDAQHSTKNASGASIPLSMDLYSNDRSNLQFTTLYKQPGASTSASPVTVLGLNGNTQLSGNTKVSSSLFLGPSTAGASTGNTSLWDRSAAKLGMGTTLGGLNITGSFVRAGQSFQGSQDYGLKVGQQTEDFGVAFDPNGSRLSAASSYQRLALAGSKGGNVTTTTTNNLNYALSSQAQLALSRQVVGRALDGTNSTTVTDLYQLNHQLGRLGSAQLAWSDVSTQSASVSDRVQTQHLTFNSNLVPHVAVTGSVVHSDSQTAGVSSMVDVGVKATPVSKLEVAASFNGRGSDLTGADNAGSFSVSALPIPKVKLTAAVTDRQAQALSTRSQDLRLDAQPLKFLSVSGGYGYTGNGAATEVDKDLRATATLVPFMKVAGMYKTRDLGTCSLDTTNVNVSLDPWKSLGVQAAISNNPENPQGQVQRYGARSLGLTANIGVLSLTTGYAYKDDYLLGQESIQTQLGMGLALARSTKFTGGYEYNVADNALGLSSRKVTISFIRDLGSDFNVRLSGSRTDTQEIATATAGRLYEANMNLGMRF